MALPFKGKQSQVLELSNEKNRTEVKDTRRLTVVEEQD